METYIKLNIYILTFLYEFIIRDDDVIEIGNTILNIVERWLKVATNRSSLNENFRNSSARPTSLKRSEKSFIISDSIIVSDVDKQLSYVSMNLKVMAIDTTTCLRKI